jgi:hypothetical protein
MELSHLGSVTLTQSQEPYSMKNSLVVACLLMALTISAASAENFKNEVNGPAASPTSNNTLLSYGLFGAVLSIGLVTLLVFPKGRDRDGKAPK